MYATGVGLVIYGAKKEPEKKFRIRDKNIFNSLVARMKKWFRDVI
jgi:cell division protein FtsA